MDALRKAAEGLECGELLVSIAGKAPHVADDLAKVAERWRAELEAAKRGAAEAAARCRDGVTEETGQAASAAASAAASKGSGWCILSGQSFQVPRGSFDVELVGQDKLCLHGKSLSYEVALADIRCCVRLQPPKDAPVKLMISLRQPLVVGKTSVSCLLVTPKPSPKSKLLTVALPNGRELSDLPDKVWAAAFAELDHSIRVEEPTLETFRSSGGEYGVPCYHGVNDGVLFPLAQGLAFIQKPTLFLPTEEIERVELERQAEYGARNFDVNVVLKDGTRHEIRMLQKDEFQPFESYVERCGINDAAAAEAAAKASGPGEGGTGATAGASIEGENGRAGGDSDESDDSSFDDEEDSSDESRSSSDRESDLDDEDIDLTQPIKEEESSSIVATVRTKRRRAAQKALAASAAQGGDAPGPSSSSPPFAATSSSASGLASGVIVKLEGEDAEPLLPFGADDAADDDAADGDAADDDVEEGSTASSNNGDGDDAADDAGEGDGSTASSQNSDANVEAGNEDASGDAAQPPQKKSKPSSSD